MTERAQYPHRQAMRVAMAIADELRPACERIEIAGSLRRRRPFVHDIDLVVIPRVVRVPGPQGGLFDGHDMIDQRVIDLRLQEHQSEGRLTDLHLADKIIKFTAASSGIPVDIYLAKESTWGTLLLIRTGSKEHNIELAQRTRRRGFILKADGTGLIDLRSGKPAGAFRDENNLFRFLGLSYIPPEDRDLAHEAEEGAL